MTKTKALLFGLIVFINIIVYFPSFFDSCRGPDHQIFLGEIAHIESLPGLISESYSYNRSRHQMTGDKVLFRPLLYLLLAFDRWFFGYDFFWWQLTAFILHLLAQWCLFRVLNTFVSLRWSFAIVLLSSLLLLQQELVGRHHISGYLFFQIFGLMAIYQFFKYCKDPGSKEKIFLISLGWLTLSFFGCECAVILNALFIALLWIPWKSVFSRFPNRHKAMIFLPIVIYGAVSGLDFLLRIKNFSYAQEGLTGSAQTNSFNIGVFLSNFANITKMGIEGFFFPAFTKIKFVGHQYNYEAFDFRLDNIPQILNALLAILFAVFFAFCICSTIKNNSTIKSFWNKRNFVLGLTMLLFSIFYAVLLCLTRLQLSPDYLRTIPHHFYFIYSFGLMGLTILIAPFLIFIERHRPIIKNAFFVLLISLSCLQGYYLHRLNNDLKNLWEPQRIFLKEVDYFVKSHKSEPDFSFVLFKSELVYTHLIYVNNQPPVQKTLVELFFPNYFKTNGPQYYLVYTKKQGLRTFKSPTDANRYVDEITEQNGKWDQEVYIGTSKVDFQKLFLLQKYLPLLKQQKK